MSGDRSLDGGSPYDAAADLVVVGAGVMGAWTALAAQRAGRRTILVDAYGVGHPRATSGDESRIMRAAHGADAFYTRWSRRARERWIAFGAEAGIPLFEQVGCLWLARRDDGFEAASEATLRAQGIPVERLGPREIESRWPQIDATGIVFAIYEPEAGLLRARRGVMAVVDAFREAGGRFELASVEPARPSGGRLTAVVAEDGRELLGEQFVFACGPWLPRLFRPVIGDLIRVTKQDVIFVGPPGGDDRFAAGRLPCFVDYDAAFYGIPAIDGRGVKVAPDRYGPVFDPSAGERIVDPDSAHLTRRNMAERFPALARVGLARVWFATMRKERIWTPPRRCGFRITVRRGGKERMSADGKYVLGLLDGAQPGEDEARFSLDRARPAQVGMRTGGDSIVTTWQGY
ncbi:MAG: FAD-dependent oxidoreductase [Chloroflexi bacterium]|nr:MAG: FAD-dependent oxidoreductase [Chloroflexota bacterium]